MRSSRLLSSVVGDRHRHRPPRLLVAVALLSSVPLGAWLDEAAAAAPSPSYVSQRTLVGLATSPSSIAVDGAGDVYIADTAHDRVVEIPAGTRTELILPFVGLQQPTAVTVDGAGDVFAVSRASESVLELPAGGGRQRQLPFSGLMSPTGIAVDGSGDVFVSDIEAKDVVELSAGASSSQVMTQFSGLIEPDAVAVDSQGTLYVGDSATMSIYALAPGASTPVRDFLDISITSLAVDLHRNLYFTDYGSTHVAYELPAGSSTDPTPLPLGSLAVADGVGVDAAGNLYVGIPDQDELAEIPAGASSYSTLPLPGLGFGNGIAVSSGGDIYVADSRNNDVLELSASGQQSVAASLVTSPPASPGGVAFDPGGDLYIGEYYFGLGELSPGGSLTQISFGGLSGMIGVAVGSTGAVYYVLGNQVWRYAGSPLGVVLPFGALNDPQLLAIDEAGDLFVADRGNDRVLELPSGSSTPLTLPFVGLSDPTGVAVDAAGDVFVTDTGNDRVLELPAGSDQQLVLPFSGLDQPDGIALDSCGDVYVDDRRNGLVELAAQTRCTPPPPSTTTSPPLTTSTSAPGTTSTSGGAAAVTSALPASTTLPRRVPAALASASVMARGDTVRVRLSCAATPPASCVLTVKVSLIEVLSHGRVVTVGAVRPRPSRTTSTRLVIAAKRRFVVRGGRTLTEPVALDALGLRLLRSHGVMRVQVRVANGPHVIAVRPERLRARRRDAPRSPRRRVPGKSADNAIASSRVRVTATASR